MLLEVICMIIGILEVTMLLGAAVAVAVHLRHDISARRHNVKACRYGYTGTVTFPRAIGMAGLSCCKMSTQAR